MGDALTRGQLVVGAIVGAGIVAFAAAWGAGAFEGPGATTTCTLEAGMDVPILPTRERALDAAGAAMLGRATEAHMKGAIWVPGGTVVTVHETSGGAARVSTPRGSGWVAQILCR